MSPLLAFALLFTAPPPAAAAATPAAGEPLAAYLADLAKAGRARPVAPSVDAIRDALADAEAALAVNDPQTAATRLFAVVESPAFAPFGYAPEYQAAEFSLGRALARGGAPQSARRYLTRVLARGVKGPYFQPAFRAMVDVALATREHEGVWTALHGLKLESSLPRDAEQELGYLRGKVEYEHGELRSAESWFSTVGRESRFYGSALYFRGLVRARLGQFQLARDAFCEIVAQPKDDRFTFFIDGRYFGVRDLANLALGRIAHEKDRHDEAYYFYFQVPDDSERLPDALFEAAWTMFQKAEYASSLTFLDELARRFPRSPLGPEASMLRAHLLLRTCRFDEARALLTRFVATHTPVLAEVRRAQGDPKRTLRLVGRLLHRDRVARVSSADDRILELLKVDPRFFRFAGWVASLDAESDAAARAAAQWEALARGPAGPATAVVEGLEREVSGLLVAADDDPEVEGKARHLLARVRGAAGGAAGGDPRFADEAEQARALGVRAAELRQKLVRASAGLGGDALAELGERLEKLLRQARLAEIDSVIGKKKKLEVQIQNLYAGRYPSELLHKLEVEGLLGDDEEYWPFEGEYWADEYEGYK